MAATAGGKVIYVDDDANSPGDGRTWATAYRYLQDALADARATAASGGDGGGNGGDRVAGILPADRGRDALDTAAAGIEIRVAQGIYRPDRSAAEPNGTGDRLASFELVGGVALVGGYAGLGAVDPNARDPLLYETILSGDLAGNDAPVQDPCDLHNEPTRSENSCNVVEIVEASGVRMEGLTITGGNANIGARDWVPPTLVGGGLRADRATDLMLRDCVFVGNQAWSTGGCHIGYSSGVVVAKCAFAQNWASTTGGLAVIYGSDTTIRECHISLNEADNTGGLTISGTELTVIDCWVTNNVARSGSGGGAFLAAGTATFIRCMIDGNSADGASGGGVKCWLGAHGTFTDCRFYGNRATTEGGGVSLLPASSVILRNCIFGGNRSERGGAVFAGSADVTILNCTASCNKAVSGSFLAAEVLPPHLGSGEVSIANSIIADGANEVHTVNIKTSIEYTLLPNEPGTIVDPNDNVTLGMGNISGDPCFADLGYWDANDGVFVIGDYHLKSRSGRFDPNTQLWARDDITSPCIDAGNPASPIGFEPFPNGGRVNMGAYGGTNEASKSYFGGPPCETIIAGDLNGDCRVDMSDFTILSRHWLADNATPEATTRTYRFVPQQSAMTWHVGRTGWAIPHSVEGEFDLTVDVASALAAFDRMDAILTNGQPPATHPEVNLNGEILNDYFYMTESPSTSATTSEVEFEGHFFEDDLERLVLIQLGVTCRARHVTSYK